MVLVTWVRRCHKPSRIHIKPCFQANESKVLSTRALHIARYSAVVNQYVRLLAQVRKILRRFLQKEGLAVNVGMCPLVGVALQV